MAQRRFTLPPSPPSWSNAGDPIRCDLGRCPQRKSVLSYIPYHTSITPAGNRGAFLRRFFVMSWHRFLAGTIGFLVPVSSWKCFCLCKDKQRTDKEGYMWFAVWDNTCMFGSLASQWHQLTEHQNDSPEFLIIGIYTQLIRLCFFNYERGRRPSEFIVN